MKDTYACGHVEERRSGIMINTTVAGPCAACTNFDAKKSFNTLMDRAFSDLGYYEHNMRRDRPYTGQPHTSTGKRGSTEVRGITFRDLHDAFIRALMLCSGDQHNGVYYAEACKGSDAVLCVDDMFKIDLQKIDPQALNQCLGVEVEKLMGIYPNVPPLRRRGED